MNPPPTPAVAAGPPRAPAHDAWQSHVMRIARVREEIADVHTYDLVCRDASAAAGYRFVPGQFNMLYLPGIGEAAISISSDPRLHDSFGHTVRAVGNVTQALGRLGPGDEVILRGPFGTGWPLGSLRGHDLLFVTGGVGLASLRAAVHQVLHDRASFGKISLLFGAKTPAGLLYAQEYETWRRHGIDVRLSVDRPDAGWQGTVGLVTTLFDGLDVVGSRTGVLCCGPEPMMKAAVKRALAAGCRREAIHLSLERTMSCAARLCGLCQFGPAFVCQDGPVFPYDRVARLLAVPNV